MLGVLSHCRSRYTCFRENTVATKRAVDGNNTRTRQLGPCPESLNEQGQAKACRNMLQQSTQVLKDLTQGRQWTNHGGKA